MAIEEKKDICSKALITWTILEREQKNIDDEDIKELFTSQVILKKFKIFGIDIVLHDMLLLILNVCVDSNPGQFQIILKDLLNNIKERKGPIPAGYSVTVEDFLMCFPMSFPIVDIPEIYEKYEKLWDKQKIKTDSPFKTNNLCDTPDWWREVMQ